MGRPATRIEMTQSAKAQEPSMEEILASIRRIIADDDTKARGAEPAKPAPAPPAAPRPAPPPRAPAAAAPRAPSPAPDMNQDDIDSMLSSIDASATKGNGKTTQSAD